MRPRSSGGAAVPAHVPGVCWPLRRARPGKSPQPLRRPAPQLPSAPSDAKSAPEPLKNEIPPAELDAVMAAHFKGLGLMEQYEYAQGGRGLPRGPQAGPGLDSRLDQPGDRAPER